jgi:flagellar biosynthesis/type III secretory pathway protein FliH
MTSKYRFEFEDWEEIREIVENKLQKIKGYGTIIMMDFLKAVYDAGVDEGEITGYKFALNENGISDSDDEDRNDYQSGWDDGYEDGQSTGYDTGHEDGEETGYDNGKEDGFNEGFDQGKEEGYSAGRENGYNEGHEEGYNKGFDEGYANGFEFGEKSQ